MKNTEMKRFIESKIIDVKEKLDIKKWVISYYDDKTSDSLMAYDVACEKELRHHLETLEELKAMLESECE